jgi:hypothetical protein
MTPVTDYKPSAFYYRQTLRKETDPAKLRVVGLTVVGELEHLKQWVRDQGLQPPKWVVDPLEAQEKGWDAKSQTSA